jgi:hypothetical protein
MGRYVRASASGYQGAGVNKPARKPSEFDDLFKHLYLDLVANGMGRRDAARELGFGPMTGINAMKADAEFGVAVEVAERLLVEAAEKKLANAALEREEPWAIKMLLERLDREKWGPESRLQVESRSTIVQQLDSPVSEALAAVEAELKERRRAIQEVEAWREDE